MTEEQQQSGQSSHSKQSEEQSEEQSTQPAPATNTTTDADTTEMTDMDEERPTTGTVRCALTGKEIPAETAHWAPPLITVRELFSTSLETLFKTPSNIKHVLFVKQPDVPYDPDAKEQLASRRTAEQLKFLLLLLVILAIIATPIVLLAQSV